MLAIIIIS